MTTNAIPLYPLAIQIDGQVGKRKHGTVPYCIEQTTAFHTPGTRDLR
jgi:hypothetical protein